MIKLFWKSPFPNLQQLGHRGMYWNGLLSHFSVLYFQKPFRKGDNLSATLVTIPRQYNIMYSKENWNFI